MKANFKFALMCAAALAMVACGGNDPKDPKNDPDEPEEPEFESVISIEDGSDADWANVPAAYLATAECQLPNEKWAALKSVKVYADQMYLNVLVEFDADAIADREWVPFHMYLNSDNSDATGGYGDEFTDANTNVLLEGGVFSVGEPVSYNPAVFEWGGEVGGSGWLWGDQTVSHDESDAWGALVGEGKLPGGVSASQFIAPNKIEFQIIREGVPVQWNETAFGIGFDIQQSWSSVGVLPNAADAEDGSQVKAAKLTVKIDKGE